MIRNIDEQSLPYYYLISCIYLKEGIHAICLQCLDKNDLHRLGITKFKGNLIVLKAMNFRLDKKQILD